MSGVLFLVGFGMGFFIWRYLGGVWADLDKLYERNPKWLFRPVGYFIVWFLLCMPVLLGMGLMAVAGYNPIRILMGSD